MKTLFVRTGFVSIVALVSILLSPAQVNQVRETGNFTKISAGGGNDISLEQGATTKVVVEAKNNELLESIVTEVEGNTLKIYNKNKIWIPGYRKIFITVNDLQSINVSGGSDLNTVNEFKADELEIIASGGSDLEMNLNTGVLNCTVSGGSDADLTGSSNKFNAVASGGSDIKASDFFVKIGEVHASGGSDIYVHSSDELSIQAGGGSDVYYSGEPKLISVNTGGGSDLHKR